MGCCIKWYIGDTSRIACQIPWTKDCWLSNPVVHVNQRDISDISLIKVSFSTPSCGTPLSAPPIFGGSARELVPLAKRGGSSRRAAAPLSGARAQGGGARGVCRCMRFTTF